MKIYKGCFKKCVEKFYQLVSRKNVEFFDIVIVWCINEFYGFQEFNIVFNVYYMILLVFYVLEEKNLSLREVVICLV